MIFFDSVAEQCSKIGFCPHGTPAMRRRMEKWRRTRDRRKRLTGEGNFLKPPRTQYDPPLAHTDKTERAY